MTSWPVLPRLTMFATYWERSGLLIHNHFRIRSISKSKCAGEPPTRSDENLSATEPSTDDLPACGRLNPATVSPLPATVRKPSVTGCERRFVSAPRSDAVLILSCLANHSL